MFDVVQLADATALPDAKLDFVGMTNLLALRAKFAGTQPVSPDRYIDESYYRDALAPLQPANPGPGGQQLN